MGKTSFYDSVQHLSDRDRTDIETEDEDIYTGSDCQLCTDLFHFPAGIECHAEQLERRTKSYDFRSNYCHFKSGRPAVYADRCCRGSSDRALPGLSVVMAISILTPITFGLEPAQGLAMLMGVYNAGVWAGGISAILVNTPGTPASIMTTLDGYSMTKRGEAGLALGINVIYSAFGGSDQFCCTDVCSISNC